MSSPHPPLVKELQVTIIHDAARSSESAPLDSNSMSAELGMRKSDKTLEGEVSITDEAPDSSADTPSLFVEDLENPDIFDDLYPRLSSDDSKSFQECIIIKNDAQLKIFAEEFSPWAVLSSSVIEQFTNAVAALSAMSDFSKMSDKLSNLKVQIAENADLLPKNYSEVSALISGASASVVLQFSKATKLISKNKEPDTLSIEIMDRIKSST